MCFPCDTRILKCFLQRVLTFLQQGLVTCLAFSSLSCRLLSSSVLWPGPIEKYLPLQVTLLHSRAEKGVSLDTPPSDGCVSGELTAAAFSPLLGFFPVSVPGTAR